MNTESLIGIFLGFVVTNHLLKPKAGIGKVYPTRHPNTRSCNDNFWTDGKGRGSCSFHRGLKKNQPQHREGVPYTQTPQIAPNRAIKANVIRAISEVLTLPKFRDIKPMTAQMIFNAFKNDLNGTVEVKDDSLAGNIFSNASMEISYNRMKRRDEIKKPLLETAGWYVKTTNYKLTGLGKELVTAIQSRVESLLNAKRGTVLFNPDIQGI